MVKDELSIEEQIIEIIDKEGYASLAELKNSFSRQSIMGNLRKLHKADKLRPFIKLDDSSTQRTIQDSEIYFSLITKPQYPHEIIKLIDRMCGDDVDREQAFDNFVELCKKRDPFGLLMGDINSDFTVSLIYKNLACILMSDMIPHLKEKVVIGLVSGTFINITKDEEKSIMGKLLPNFYDPMLYYREDEEKSIIDKLLSIFYHR